jgi:hypothetical protein
MQHTDLLIIYRAFQQIITAIGDIRPADRSGSFSQEVPSDLVSLMLGGMDMR